VIWGEGWWGYALLQHFLVRFVRISYRSPLLALSGPGSPASPGSIGSPNILYSMRAAALTSWRWCWEELEGRWSWRLPARPIRTPSAASGIPSSSSWRRTDATAPRLLLRNCAMAVDLISSPVKPLGDWNSYATDCASHSQYVKHNQYNEITKKCNLLELDVRLVFVFNVVIICRFHVINEWMNEWLSILLGMTRNCEIAI